MSDIVIRGMEIPESCDTYRLCDDYGDYPRCIVTDIQRGYSRTIIKDRMNSCPLVEVKEVKEGVWVTS